MRRTAFAMLLWAAPAFGFYAFYQVFQVRPDGEPTPSLLPGVALALGVAALVYWVRRPRARLVSPFNEGIELLNRGRASEALAKFVAMHEASKSPVMQYNAGVARLFLWQLDAAMAAFEAALKQSENIDLVRRGAPMLLALAASLKGAAAAADAWLQQTDARDRDLGNVLLARAALLCRAGDFAAARALLSRHEVKQLGGFYSALAHTLYAWCVEQTQGELRHVDRIALFGETGPERLKAAWPELAAFVERAPAA